MFESQRFIGQWCAATFVFAVGVAILTHNHAQIWARYPTDDELDHFFRATALLPQYIRLWFMLLLVSLLVTVLVRHTLARTAAVTSCTVSAAGLAYNVTLSLGSL